MSDYLTPVGPTADTQEVKDYTNPEDILTSTGVPSSISLSKAIESTNDPEHFRYKVEGAKYLADMLDIEPQHIYDNWNSYVRDLSGKEMPPQQFDEYIQDVWQQSLKSSEIGLLEMQNSLYGETDERLTQIEELQKSLPDVNISDQPFFRRAAGATTRQIGQYYHAAPEAGTKALALGSGLAAAGAAGGLPAVAGPQAALTAPAYASSVGALFTSGVIVGAVEGVSEHLGKISGGHLYRELRDDGVSHDTARWAAAIGVFTEAAIESAQVTAIPGLDDLVGRTYKKMMTNGSIKQIFTQNAAKWAGRTAEETGEEVLQTFSQEMIGNITRDIYEEANGETVDWGSYEEFMDELKEVAIETPMSMGAMGTVGTVNQTIRDIRNTRGVRTQVKQKQEWDKAAKEKKEQQKSKRPNTGQMSEAEVETRFTELEQEYNEIYEKLERGEARKSDFTRLMEIEEEAEYLRQERVAEETPATPEEAEVKRYSGKESYEMTREEWQQTKDKYSKSTERRYSGKEIREKIQNTFGWNDETMGVAEAYLGHFAKKKGMMLDEYLTSRIADVRGVDPENATNFQGKRGGIELKELEDELKGIIYVSKNGDFTTFVHEMFHAEERRASKGFDSVLSREDIDTLHEWARGLTDDPDYQKVRQGTWDEQTYIAEKTAQAAENYLKTGQAPNSRLAEIFQRIAQLISEVYSRLRYNLPDLNDDVKAVFDRLYGDKDSGLYRAAEQKEDVLFQQSSEAEKAFNDVAERGITNNIMEAGYVLPDGRMIDLTGRGEVLFQPAPPVESEAFKQWFGNSKVVDENGNPKVVYHGTSKPGFNEFVTIRGTERKSGARGTHFGTIEQATNIDTGGGAAGIYPVYLSIENPLRVTNKEADWNIDLIKKLKNEGYIDQERADEFGKYTDETDKVISDRRIIRLLQSLGFDGLVYDNEVDGIGESYVAFEPTQIKSVNNKGTFDPNNPNILYQVGPVYHGSPYQFDSFTTEKMGTGEGAQAFGWGLYFTDQEQIARHYADTLTKGKNTYTSLDEYIETVSIGDKTLADYGLGGYDVKPLLDDNKQAGRYEIKPREELIKVTEEEAAKWEQLSKDEDYPFQEMAEKKAASFKDLQEDIKADKSITAGKARRNLYATTLHKGKDTSEYTWIDWYEGIDKDTANRIKDQAKEETLNYGENTVIDRSEHEKRTVWQMLRNVQPSLSYYDDISISFTTSRKLYDDLSAILGSQEMASRFLLRAGIDGIRYPAGSLSGGGEGTNYVVFDENAVTVEEHTLFQEGPIEYDEHYEAVRRAVEKGRYVPDRVLNEYRGEPWADAELGRRTSLTTSARGYDNAEDYIVESKANDPEPKPSSYYEQLWHRSQQIGAQEKEANQRWLTMLDKETLTAYLYEVAQIEEVEDIPLRIVEVAEVVKEQGKLTDGAYNALYEEFNANPTYYRGLLHSYLGEDNTIVQNVTRAMWEEDSEVQFSEVQRENAEYSEELRLAVETAESEEDFVQFYLAMGEQDFSEQQLSQIYRDITEPSEQELQQRVADRAANNKKFVAELDEKTLTSYLAELAARDMLEGLDPLVANVAKRTISKGDMGKAYDKVLVKIKDDPFSYRQLFAAAFEDEEEIRILQIEQEQITQEERLREEASRLREKTRKLEQSHEKLTHQLELDAKYEKDLQKQIKELNRQIKETEQKAKEVEKKADKAGRKAEREAEKAESEKKKTAEVKGKWKEKLEALRRDKNKKLKDQRAQLINEKQRKVKEVRDLYKRKIQIEKMIRRIMKKPTATIAWGYQQEIRKIQNKYFVDKAQKKRREKVLRDALSDRVQYKLDKEMRDELERELEELLQQNVLRQLPYEKLQELDEKLKELRKTGRVVRTQQINEENRLVNDIKRQIRMQMRGVVVSDEMRKWAEDQLPQELYGSDYKDTASIAHLQKYTLEQLVALDERMRELKAKGLKSAAKLFETDKESVRVFHLKLNEAIAEQSSIEQRTAKGSRQEQQRVKTGVWENVQLNWYTPERVAELLDGGPQQIFHKLMTEDVNAIYDEYLRRYKERTQPILEYMKDKGITQRTLNERIDVVPGKDYRRQEIIGFYLQMKNDKSRRALLHGDNLTVQEVNTAIDQLTDEEKDLAEMMLKDLNSDENYDRLLQALIEDRNEGMEKVDNYFTMIRQNQGFSKLNEQVADDLLQSSGKGYPRVRSGWRNSRLNIRDEYQIPIRHDAFNIWAGQVMHQEKFINYQSHIKRLARIFVKDREISEMIRQTHGEKANEILRNYANDLSSTNIYRDTTENILAYLRRNMGMAYLGLNATTPPKQLVSLAYAMGKSSPVDIITSAGRFMRNPMRFWDEAKSRDIQYEFRTMETLIEELKQNKGEKFHVYQHYMQKLGFSGIRLFDRIAYGIGEDAIFHAQKRKLMREGMREDEAVENALRIAQEEMARTQPSANVQNLPEAYRRSKEKELNKLALMFSNQLNKMFNIVTWDIPNSMRQKQYMQAIGYMAGMVAGAIAMGVISRKRLPEKWGEAGEDIFTQLMSTIPFVGREVVTAWDGWGTGIEITPALTETVTSSRTFLNSENEWEDHTNAVIDILLESMTLVGAPQVQLNRVMKTFMDEDFNAQFEPWELLGANERGED